MHHDLYNTVGYCTVCAYSWDVWGHRVSAVEKIQVAATNLCCSCAKSSHDSMILEIVKVWLLLCLPVCTSCDHLIQNNVFRVETRYRTYDEVKHISSAAFISDRSHCWVCCSLCFLVFLMLQPLFNHHSWMGINMQHKTQKWTKFVLDETICFKVPLTNMLEKQWLFFCLFTFRFTNVNY